jgi:hypothetical protein
MTPRLDNWADSRITGTTTEGLLRIQMIS